MTDIVKYVVQSDRMRLRPTVIDDMSIKVKWYNDRDVRKTMTLTEQFELEKTRAWFLANQHNNSRFDFFVETIDGQPIGLTGLLHIDHAHAMAECYCSIGEKLFWGRGFGTEIHSILIAWAFEYLSLYKIWATIRTNNPAIYKVVQKLGFQIEGTLRKEKLLEGTREDLYRIGLLREDFTPIHTRMKVDIL